MIISIGAGCFVSSIVFLLWEQQGFVPVNSYPIKLLLDLNFHLQIIQEWKKLKAYIPNWRNWQLLFLFFSGQSENCTIENIKNNCIALGVHQKIFEQINILWKPREFFKKLFCSLHLYICISVPEALVSPAYFILFQL